MSAGQRYAEKKGKQLVTSEGLWGNDEASALKSATKANTIGGQQPPVHNKKDATGPTQRHNVVQSTGNPVGKTYFDKNFEEYCRNCIVRSDYLDMVAALKETSFTINKVSARFRDVQSLNMKVDNIVNCYLYIRNFQSYSELEEIVMREINNFQQRDIKGKSSNLPCNTFEGFGIGSLASHGSVAKNFGFSIPCDSKRLQNVTHEDIMMIAFSYLKFNLKVSPKNSNEDLTDVERFNTYLKRELASKYSCCETLIGVRVRSFRDFYFGGRSILHAESFVNSLRKCSDECSKIVIDEYRREMTESLTVRNSSPVSAATVVKRTREIVEHFDCSYKDFTSTLEGAEFGDPFIDLFYAVSERAVGSICCISELPKKSSRDIEPENPIDSLHLLNILEGSESYLISSEKMECQTVQLFVGFVCYLTLQMTTTRTAANTNKKKNGDTISDEYNRLIQHMKGNLKEDVPHFAVKALELFLKEIITLSVFDDNGGNSLSININSVNDKCNEFFPNEWSKGGYRTLKYAYIAVITGSILMHRIMQLEPPTLEQPTLQSAVAVSMEAAMKTVETDSDPVSFITGILCQAEGEVMKTLNVPAVSCLRKGTFLRYLLTENAPALRELSTTFFNGKSWNSTGGSGVHSSDIDCEGVTDEDLRNSIISCMEDLVRELDIMDESEKCSRLISLMLRLEDAVTKSLGLSTFPASFSDYISDLISDLYKERENDSESDNQDNEDSTLRFRTVYDSLLNALPNSHSNSSNSGDTETSPAALNDFLSYLCNSSTVYSAFSAYTSHQSSGLNSGCDFVSFREYLGLSLGIHISDEECSRIEPELLLTDIVISPNVTHIPPTSTSIQSDTNLTTESRSMILSLLSAVPLGQSCATWCLWCPQKTKLYGCILDLIASTENTPDRITRNVKYVAVHNGNGMWGDCIPVPYYESTASTTALDKTHIQAIAYYMDTDNHTSLAAWCLSAYLGYTDESKFRDALADCMSPRNKKDGLDNLVRFMVKISVVLPSCTRVGVCTILMRAVEDLSEISAKDMQKVMFDSHFRTAASTSAKAALLSLVSDVQHCKEFSELVRLVHTLDASSYIEQENRSVSISEEVIVPIISAASGEQVIVNTPVDIDRVASNTLSIPTLLTTIFSTESANVITEHQKHVQQILLDTGKYVVEKDDDVLVRLPDRAVDKTCDRMLEELSTGIFSKEVQFIYELIQNADDNSYFDGVVPSIFIDLNDVDLRFHNNEIGWQKQHITAACTVKLSTKEGIDGFTGQKGIGIKSVFNVCDTFEIHSNYFHIAFDRKICMIEPILLHQSRWLSCHFTTDHTGSVLRLPFKGNKYHEISTKLRDVFSDTLLLFLRKLCSIQVVDKRSALQYVLHREIIPVDDKVVWMKIQNSKEDSSGRMMNSSYWYVKTETFTPKLRRSDKYENISDTKVSIAVRFEMKNDESIEILNDCGADMSTEIAIPEGPGKLRLGLPYEIPLYRIYAYLPTNIAIFRFILQADFNLNAARDWIVEGNLFNKNILERVPDLFVEMIVDMASAVRDHDYIRHNADLGSGLPCPFSEHDVTLTFNNILSLMPKLSSVETTNELFKAPIQSIYAKLKKVPFLRSSAGTPWPSSQLIAVDCTSHNPAQFIPEDLLVKWTGKRYMADLKAPIDGEILDLLGIKSYSLDTVLSCVNALCDDKENDMCNTALAGVLLSLEKHSAKQRESTAVKAPPLLVPSRVIKNSLGSNRPIVPTTSTSIKIKEACSKLRGCNIWPVSGSADRTSLDNKVIFIKKLNEKSDLYLDLIPTQLISYLDDDLFDKAKEITTGGGEDLSKWLLSHFKPPSKVFDTHKDNETSGGIEILTHRELAINVILKSYKDGHQFSRVSACASLALMYTSKIPFEEAAVIPTLTARVNNKDELRWTTSKLVQSHKNDKNSAVRCIDNDVEVHFGAESEQNATCVLAKKEIKTALQQMEYTIIDPLVGALALQLPQKAVEYLIGNPSLADDEYFVEHTEAEDMFKKSAKELKDYQNWLKKLGCVDLFSVHEIGGVASTPFLPTFINQIISGQSNEKKIVSTDKGEKGYKLSSPYFPIYRTRPDIPLLLVSKTAYMNLCCVFQLIEGQLKSMNIVRSNPPSWLRNLRESSFCPSVCTGLALSDEYFVASPLNFLTDKHCHVHLTAHPALTSPDSLLISSPVMSDESMEQHRVLLLSWMSRQDEIYTSIKFMTDMYIGLNKISLMSSHLIGIVQLLMNHQKFLWIPNEKIDSGSTPQWGSLHPLNRILYATPQDVQYTDFIKGPLRVLNENYTDTEVLRLFSRTFRNNVTVCFACQMQEGMHGARGVSYYGGMRGMQKCLCEDYGFGRYVPSLPGLVKKKLSLRDLLTILEHSRNEIRTFKCIGEVKKEEMTVISNMRKVLIGISIALWQSFRIKRALHPYSASSLEEMKEIFRVQDLFPMISQTTGQPLREFTSASVTDITDLSDAEMEDDCEEDAALESAGVVSSETVSSTSTSIRSEVQSTTEKKIKIAVDDSSLFAKLRIILEERKVSNIYWIDGSSNYSTDTVNVTSAPEFDNLEEMTYDIQALKDDTEKSLNMSHEEFTQVCTDLQAITFFAPITSAALYHFLKIPTLSSLFTERIQSIPQVLVPSLTSSSLTSRMHKYLNSLLEIAQRQIIMVIGEHLSVLVGTTRMQRVVNLAIKECSGLERHLDMNAPHLGPEFDNIAISQPIQFHWSWSGDAPLTVFIRDTISTEDLLDTCINLIMQPLLIEIAIMRKNRENELMLEIRKNMKKFARKPDSLFAFEYDEIPELPTGVDPWIVLSCIDVEEINNDEEEEEEEEEEVVKKTAVYTEEEQLKIDEYNKAVQDREQNRADRIALLKKQQVVEPPVEVLDPKYYPTSSVDEANKVYVSQRTEEMKNIAEYYVATPDVGVMPVLEIAHYEGTRYPSGGARLNADNNGDFDKYSTSSMSDPQGHRISSTGGNRDHASEKTGNTVRIAGYTARDADFPPLRADHSVEKGDFAVDRTDYAAESRGAAAVAVGMSETYSRQAVDTHNYNTLSYTLPDLHNPADNNDKARHIGAYGQGNSHGDGRGYGLGNGQVYDQGNGQVYGQGIGQGFGGEFNNFSPIPIRSTVPLDLSGILSNDAFNNLTLASINRDNAGESTDLGSKVLGCNATTGRLGEYFAYQYLKSHQEALGLNSVIWLNKDNESFGPFDICLITGTGTKYCEVKATSFAGEIGTKGSVQWFISSAEVKAAETIGKDYFAICLSIAVDKVSGRPAPSAMYMIGWDRGLSDSLLCKEASLLLQVNT